LLYLLDANVLIDANRDYYPIERVPEFWEWLENVGENGHVKIPLEVYEEISEGKDKLANWAKQEQIKIALLFQEEVDVSLVSYATDHGYASDLTDDEVETIGRDPFLIAYALKNKAGRCLVTTEVSKPKRLRANRHLPDVCADLGVRCYNTFEFLRALNFSTKWNSP
jgi:rRNA-processing protein FCF1